MSKQHALVTGGAGFIGSHLCDHLIQQGWQVTAVDDLSTGRTANVSHLEANSAFSLHVAAVADQQHLARLTADVDVVFHLASVVGVRRVMEDTVQTIEKNLHAMEAVLHACAARELRLLTTSTSEVYGSNPKAPFHETDNAIIGPSPYRRWSYAAVKLLEEFHAYAYYHSKALPVTIVRPFNTIGPRQVGHYGMVVPTFAQQALRGDPITVLGDGHQKRAFTYVGDTVRCLHELALCDAAIGQIYNVGGREEISILDLAQTIKAMTASTSAIIHKSYDDVYGENFVDLERRLPDTSRLRQVIGFAPDTPLASMLQIVIDDMRKQPS